MRLNGGAAQACAALPPFIENTKWEAYLLQSRFPISSRLQRLFDTN